MFVALRSLLLDRRLTRSTEPNRRSGAVLHSMGEGGETLRAGNVGSQVVQETTQSFVCGLSCPRDEERRPLTQPIDPRNLLHSVRQQPFYDVGLQLDLNAEAKKLELARGIENILNSIGAEKRLPTVFRTSLSGETLERLRPHFHHFSPALPSVSTASPRSAASVELSFRRRLPSTPASCKTSPTLSKTTLAATTPRTTTRLPRPVFTSAIVRRQPATSLGKRQRDEGYDHDHWVEGNSSVAFSSARSPPDTVSPPRPA